MADADSATCTAFEGNRRIASGILAEVAAAAKMVFDRSGASALLVFDDETSRAVEIDFRGSVEDVVGRIAVAQPEPIAAAAPASRGPGRPRLGVVAREVTLLPRHWDWLNTQPGGASVALRKLVEDARRANADVDRMRVAQESAYRFMSALGGDAPGFEAASRALFAGDAEQFDEHTQQWPEDVRDHARMLAARSFALPGHPSTRGYIE